MNRMSMMSVLGQKGKSLLLTSLLTTSLTYLSVSPSLGFSSEQFDDVDMSQVNSWIRTHKVPVETVEGLRTGEPQLVMVVVANEKIRLLRQKRSGKPRSEETIAIQAEISAEEAKLKDRVLRPLAGHGISVVRTYDNMPMAVIRVDNLAALSKLLRDADVRGVNKVTLPEDEAE